MGVLARLRRDALVRLMKAGAARGGTLRVGALELEVLPGVCHPAPFGGVSLEPLFRAALRDLEAGASLLDLGAGCGIWGLLAAQAGATVTCTDLPHVDLSPIARAAQAHGLAPPRLATGDLFAPVAGERFDRIVFNPPFHFGQPADDAERAYLGGAGGEVVHRFLDALPAHLAPGGRAFVILPDEERRGYAAALARYGVRELAWRRLPVLGRVAVLELTPVS